MIVVSGIFAVCLVLLIGVVLWGVFDILLEKILKD